MTGVLAVVVCAYLAAVYLTADARRAGDALLVAQFRTRALTAGVAAGAVAAGGLIFLHQEAAVLYQGLLHRGLPLVVISAIAGILSLTLLYRRRFLTARISAACAVTAVLWAWAAAQYPQLLSPGLTIGQAAADRPVLVATLISLAGGAVLLIPSLAWLYILFQRTATEGSRASSGHGNAV